MAGGAKEFFGVTLISFLPSSLCRPRRPNEGLEKLAPPPGALVKENIPAIQTSTNEGD
jgi:hypothetical protein